MTESLRHRPSRVLGSLLFTAALPFVVTASLGCRVEGDRAEIGGACPEGETCSAAAPRGLLFHGAPLSGTLFGGFHIAPTARGGTQRVTFEPPDEGALLPSFDAVSSADDVLRVVDRESRGVWLRAESEGTALLRVVETFDGSLLDRVSIDARPVDRLFVFSADDLLSTLAPEHAMAFVPGEHTIAIRLLDRDGSALVDESMVIEGPDHRYEPLPRGNWDARDVEITAEGLPLAVEAGGRSFELAVRAAGAIDGLDIATWLYEEGEDGAVVTTPGSLVCAVRTSSDAWVIGEPDPATILRVDGQELETSAIGAWTCASIERTAPLGDIVIEAQLGELRETAQVTLVDTLPVAGDSLIGAPSGVLLRTPRFAIGERAAALTRSE